MPNIANEVSTLKYIAGFFDADGSVSLVRNGVGEHRTPQVSFANNERSILETIKKFFGGGAICTKAPRKETHAVSYDLKYSYRKALKVLESLYPYIKHQKKRYRANLLLKDYTTVTKRNGCYNEQELSKKLAFENIFFEPELGVSPPQSAIVSISAEYIAGFLDADGCVTLTSSNKGKNKTASVSFYNNEKNILEDIETFLGPGVFSTKKHSNKNWSTSYSLTYRYQKGLAALQKISQHLKHPKKCHRVSVLLEEYLSVTHRAGKYTEEMLAAKHAMERRFFQK